MAATDLIDTEGLVKIYHRRKVVDGVSISVREGEVVGLLGPNGAGKTTTFYMTVGLVRANGGVVRFKGRDVTGVPMHHRARLGMGFLSQEPSIFRGLTVEQNVLAILEMLPLTRAERKKRLDFLLNELSIQRLAEQPAFTLSGGERRRLEITRALVTNPAALLLDEPFSGVDPLAVYDVQEIIRGLRAKGLGILITDHNVRETLDIIDRVSIISAGSVLFEGTADEAVHDAEVRRVYLGEMYA